MLTDKTKEKKILEFFEIRNKMISSLLIFHQKLKETHFSESIEKRKNAAVVTIIQSLIIKFIKISIDF